MLEIVNNKISQLIANKDTFDSYFTKYIFRMQDQNIESEVSGVEKHNILQVNDVAKLINKEYEEFLNMVDNI